MNAPAWWSDQQPIRWAGRHPIYLAHYIAVGFGLSMVLTAVMSGLGLATALSTLSFLSPEVFHGQVWRILTYGLVNEPSIWFVIELAMIGWFGQEVEKFFGRGVFLLLFGWLYLIPPLVHTLVGLWLPTALVGEAASFGLFIAFVTLYPEATLIFNLLAKWIAWVLLGVYSLQYLAIHDWVGLLSLWAASGFAYGFVLYHQGRIQFPSLPQRQTAEPVRVATPRPAANAMAEIDALLDKVARSGLASLSDKERAKLNSLHEKLKRRTGN